MVVSYLSSHSVAHNILYAHTHTHTDNTVDVLYTCCYFIIAIMHAYFGIRLFFIISSVADTSNSRRKGRRKCCKERREREAARSSRRPDEDSTKTTTTAAVPTSRAGQAGEDVSPTLASSCSLSQCQQRVPRSRRKSRWGHDSVARMRRSAIRVLLFGLGCMAIFGLRGVLQIFLVTGTAEHLPPIAQKVLYPVFIWCTYRRGERWIERSPHPTPISYTHTHTNRHNTDTHTNTKRTL